MTQEYFRQANFTNGELDPAMLGRRDLKSYYFSTASALNHIISPQGPMSRRPGLAAVGRIRNPLLAVAIPAAAITAPNGGVADNARLDDGNLTLTTGNLSTTDPYVVLAVDFGAAVTVSAVDVVDYGVVAGNITVAPPPPPPSPVLPFPGVFNIISDGLLPLFG